MPESDINGRIEDFSSFLVPTARMARLVGHSKDVSLDVNSFVVTTNSMAGFVLRLVPSRQLFINRVSIENKSFFDSAVTRNVCCTDLKMALRASGPTPPSVLARPAASKRRSFSTHPEPNGFATRKQHPMGPRRVR